MEANEAERERYGPGAAEIPAGDGTSLAEQAKALLEGQERWRPTWVDYGAPVEVEQELDGEDDTSLTSDVPLTRTEVR